MDVLHETRISRAIIAAYHEELVARVVSDVLVVGAGPSGLMAAMHLAHQGVEVTVLEKRLSPGGGIWGGGMAMNRVVIEDRALPLVDEMGVRSRPVGNGLHLVDALELASALCLGAIQAGAAVLNLTVAEDLCVHQGRVRGVVANRTGIPEAVPVDPITLEAGAVLDATGHHAALVRLLHRRKLLPDPGGPPGEGPMDATQGESFVEDNVTEIYPGLWISGMCVAAALGGPRMGPIFGGMLLSGKRAADRIGRALEHRPP
jgi:sulfide-dependent adenosine diphosphate thiazole synthase